MMLTRALEAHGTYDRQRGIFRLRTTLPSVTAGAHETTAQYDPGATCVVLSHADLRAMGLRLNSMRYTIEADTVCGVLLCAPVMLPMMGVGCIRINDVRALVPQDDCGVSLLGQSALQKFSAVEQRGDTLVFRR